MNFKTTYALFGFLVLIVILLGVVVFYKPEPELARGGYLLPSLNDQKAPIKQTDIKRLEIERTRPAEQKLVFERGADDKWVMLEPTKVRTDNGAVEALVGQLVKARRS